MRNNEILQVDAKARSLLQMHPLQTVPGAAGAPDIYLQSAQTFIRPDVEVNAAKDGNIGWLRLASTVKSSVRCD